MTKEIVIISPELKAGAGGLADYALRIVEEWGGRVPVRFVVPAESERSATHLRAELPASGGKVLLHYSAYGFDRHGYPRWLLQSLADWKRTSGGLLVIMFHEIWTFWPWLNKNRFLQWRHRSHIQKLVSAADAVFTSTPSQAKHLLQLVPTTAVQVLPVGSNIRPMSPIGPMREPGLAVLFGLPASRQRARQTMQRELDALVATQRLTKIVEVGGDALPEEEVSSLLAQASFGISAQDELSVTKSGTFMAYAAHGLNILSPFSGAARPQPLCWATHPDELRQGLSDAELNSRAENLRTWQERTCAWPRIAEQFARALALPTTAPHS